MLIHEIYMVPAKAYDQLEKSSIELLKRATMGHTNYRVEYKTGDITIRSRGNILFVFIKDTAVGVLDVTDASLKVKEIIGRQTWQVKNVYILPEHRNKRLGLLLYHHILHRRKQAFAAGAALTPSSRRIYDSLLRDSTVDVYALYFEEVKKQEYEYRRVELHLGPDGITTGDRDIDKNSEFVAVGK